MATEPAKEPQLTPVNFQHSPSLVPLLERLGLSLLVSTYQAGKVITVGVHEGKADISFHQFEQAMGLARTKTGIAIGAKRQIWTLHGSTALAPKVKPEGKHDIALLTRSAHYTGPVMGHEMGYDFAKGELWFVNTLFSCLCVVHPDYNFVPRWKPPFITELGAEDRCHLNGLAMEGDEPRYVTALGKTNAAGGWRENKATGGMLMDVKSNEVVVDGLCMPHSPRIHQGSLYYLDSGKGHLCRRDGSGSQVVASVQGYARGMEIWGQYAFVGLSKIRETSVFGGVPIAEKRDQLRCGVSIIDLQAGAVVGFLHFQSGVDEIFEVKVVPGYRNPIVSGPLPDADQTETIWLAPPLPK